MIIDIELATSFDFWLLTFKEIFVTINHKLLFFEIVHICQSYSWLASANFWKIEVRISVLLSFGLRMTRQGTLLTPVICLSF